LPNVANQKEKKKTCFTYMRPLTATNTETVLNTLFSQHPLKNLTSKTKLNLPVETWSWQTHCPPCTCR